MSAAGLAMEAVAGCGRYAFVGAPTRRADIVAIKGPHGAAAPLRTVAAHALPQRAANLVVSD